MPGRELVNKDHPHVVEIWNLVLWNTSADGSLEPLPQKHVDTGMGLNVLYGTTGVKSNYDTDVFNQLFERLKQFLERIMVKMKNTILLFVWFLITFVQLPFQLQMGSCLAIMVQAMSSDAFLAVQFVMVLLF